MDAIPLDARLVKGSHGHLTNSISQSPILITQQSNVLKSKTIEAKEEFDVILNHLV